MGWGIEWHAGGVAYKTINAMEFEYKMKNGFIVLRLILGDGTETIVANVTELKIGENWASLPWVK